MTYFNCFVVVLIIVVNLICISIAQNVDKNMLCNSKETCGECIQEKGCIWCSSTPVESAKETNNFVRCIAESMKTSEWCPDDLINNPKPQLNKLSDQPLKSATIENEQVIQFRPQKIHLKLRRNQEYKFDFQYAQGVDYPVDLYYLMDLSHSMDTHRAKLSHLGEQLAIAMRNITQNFKMGFGSFVEKVTMPFVSIVPEKLLHPCPGKKCIAPYSYRNHLSLTSNSTKFTEEVHKARTSGNLDSPEDGFDAILQSIVCEQQIGWRENATRLLVFSTDAGYHYAGDGKLAGIVEPHDGRCYLNDKGEYTHALKFDYPSISFINRHVRKHNIDLLFAVTKQVEETYKNLATRIAGAQLGILDAQSTNVVELVSKVYDKLKHTLVINDNAGPDVHIDYFTKCLNWKKEMKTNNCTDIRFNQEVKFTAVIRATSCKRQTIEIKRRSLSDSLVIDLEVDCECDCEKPENKLFTANSSLCNSTGSLACGVCKCNPGRLGKFCECDDNSESLNNGNTNGCKQTNSTDETVCSGRGDCKCGKCICHKGRKPGEEYSGPYCQCDNFSCRKSDNKMCSGHGVCECRQCICDPGFTGPACECDLRPETCIQQGTIKRCSDHGECACGKCKCSTGYWGEYCQYCPDCPGQKCSDFVDCVECKQFPNSGKYSIEQCNNECTNISIVSVPDIDIVNSSDSNVKYKDCEHVDNNGCTIFFKHTLNDMSYNIKKVYVQKEKKCPAKVDLLSLMLFVIGTIVLAGIVLLVVWKIFTEVHDRREYIRFERERQNQKFGGNDNPLYREPTTTICNPVYNKDS